MKQALISTIIFDLGNVLLDFDHTIAAKKIARLTHKSLLEIFNLFFDSEITGFFEEGKISPYDFYLKVQEMLGSQMTYEDFLSVWNDIFTFSDKNKQVYALAKELRERYTVVVLSNINALHHEYIKKKFAVLKAFDRVFTSYEIGFRKPHPQIYKIVCSKLKVSPEQIFYTDDRPELIAAAGKLRINGFVFTGIKQLKQDLKSALLLERSYA